MEVLEFRGYRVLAPLGQGGFGKTYLVEDTQSATRQRYVIKQFCPTVNNPRDREIAQERFEREAAVLLDLGRHHDQIPRLFSYFSQEDGFYLVLEYIQGMTLTQKFRQTGPLSEAFITQLLTEVLAILEFVHARRIIHRDVKPDNIIVREDDKKPVLIDFGAVKESVQTQVVSDAAASRRSIVIGSPGFMAPEQAAGRPNYVSDLYSLGMTAIYLLTGRLPQDFVPDPGEFEVNWESALSQVSPHLALVLAKSIRFNPTERYGTAREMRLALTLESEDRPTQLVQSGQLGRGQANPGAPNGANQPPSTQPTQVVAPLAAPPAVRHKPSFGSGNGGVGNSGVAAQPALKLGRWLGIVGAAAFAFALGWGSIYFYTQQQSQGILQAALRLKDQGRFQDCLSQLAGLAGSSSLSDTAIALKGECQLGLAKNSASQGNLTQAVEQVALVPENLSLTVEARRLEGQWVRSLLQQAGRQYQQGDLQGAVTMAASISATSHHRQEAEQAIKQWQKEWQRNQENLKTAEKAVENGNWQLAQALLKRLTTPYWQTKGGPILQKATQLQAQPTPPPVASATGDTQPTGNSEVDNSEVDNSEFKPETATALIQELYRQVSSKNYSAARQLFAPGLSDQFNSTFFDQFRQVSVENLVTSLVADDEIILTGENTYTWPDGSTQRELRSFTVNRVNGKAVIADSRFIRVLKIRS